MANIVTVSVGIHDNALKLFFGKGKERSYKAIEKNLLGKFQVSHWDKKNHRIKHTVSYSAENNETIAGLVNQYTGVVARNKDITLKELSHYFDENKSRALVSIDNLIKRHIKREKQKTSGCNYENYEKLHRRLLGYRPDLAKISISSVDEAFCASFRDWLVYEYKTNYEKTTKCFMAFLRRISEDKTIDWSVENIDGYSFKKNAPDSNTDDDELPVILSEDEILSFRDFNPVAYKGKREANTVEAYHDYCRFMLETYIRPVDALLLKRENIIHSIECKQPVIRYIQKKKKNQRNGNRTVQVPLSRAALDIIEKYKNQSQDGYVFPFMSEERIKGYKKGEEGLSKRINLQINVWLKTVDKVLNLNKGFHLYIFRHTAISYALNVAKIPAPTVSKIAGVSMDVIQKHYNNHLIADIPVGILDTLGEKNTHNKAI
jgi:integrase